MSLPQTPSFQQIQLNLNGKLSSQTKPSQTPMGGGQLLTPNVYCLGAE